MKNEKYVMIVETSGKDNTLKINESSTKSTKLQLEGKFTEFDIENRNKRMYTAQKFIPYMNLLLEKKKALGVVYGEYDHPDVFDVTCKNLSHVIDSLTHNESSNCVDGSITLLNNHWGKEARSIIEDGHPLFVSSRAAGVTDSNGVVQLKELFTYDIVADPGFSSARVTPKMINESLGFESTDEVPYRIYEMNDTHVNVLFDDNKNDNKTKMDLIQFEAFLNSELIKFESQLMEKINGKYAPTEATDLLEQIEIVKNELNGVNKILEFFRTKMNVLITDNSKLKDENKKLNTEISENLLHNNHLTSKLKSLTTYAKEIDERLNNSEGLLEHVAKHTEANILFSKDIAENLSTTAKEVEATQGLLEHVAKHTKDTEDALLITINEATDIIGFTEDLAKEVEATQGLLEHTAKEAYIDSTWLTYIKEKVDGIIEYNSELVESLKSDNKTLLKESVNSTTELSKLESIETYLGLDKELELINQLEETKIATASTKIAVNEEEIVNEIPVETEVPGMIDEPIELGTPEITEPIEADDNLIPVTGDMVNTITEVPEVEEHETEEPIEDVTSMEVTLLNSLVKVLGTDETGVVIEITPDNKLIIQKSGTDDRMELATDEVEELDLDADNIVETVTNLVSEIKKQKALNVKEPHFFSMLSEKQIVEFKQLDNDTQAGIVLLMENKEYYNSTDVLNHISTYMQDKTVNKEDNLIKCIPDNIKESWNGLNETDKKTMLAESVYFPLRTELDMINFWNTRNFKKDEIVLIKESIDYDKESQSIIDALNNL